MSFSAYETSAELGAPIELYQFIYGDTSDSVYRYCTADRDQFIMDKTWKAAATQRANYKASGKVEKGKLDVKLPVQSDIAALYTAYPPTQEVSVTIWAGHLNDADEQFLVTWTGRVLSTAKSTTELTLTCESSLISLKRPGLSRNWQYACPYTLYDGRSCKANRDAATRTLPVVAITEGGGIVFQEGWNAGVDPIKYAGGMFRWRGDTGWEYRTIHNVNEDGSLSYAGILRSLAVGDSVDLILGCNHQESDCQALHNNILNFGGQPWIPIQNPVRYANFW